MKDKNLLLRLNQHQKIIVEEMIKRDINIEKIDNTDIYIASYGNHKEIFIRNYFETFGHGLGIILGNKYDVLQILKHNKISIPDGQLFTYKDGKKIINFVKKIGPPVIFRHTNPYKGISSFTVNNRIDLYTALEKFKGYIEPFIIEKVFNGINLRVCVTKDDWYNVLQKNKYLSLNDQHGLIFQDVTPIVHASIYRLAKKIIKFFKNTKLLGFDIIVKKINKPLVSGDYVITELYPTIGVSFYSPFYRKGKTTKAKILIVELLFPETHKTL